MPVAGVRPRSTGDARNLRARSERAVKRGSYRRNSVRTELARIVRPGGATLPDQILLPHAEPALGLVSVVCTTTQLQVVDRSLAAIRESDKVVILEKAALGAPLIREMDPVGHPPCVRNIHNPISVQSRRAWRLSNRAPR